MEGPSQAPVQSLGNPPGERHDELGPIIALIALFAVLGCIHLVTFIYNCRRGHWFIFSAMLFVLAALRITALALRLCWTERPRDSRLALSAQLFVACGTVIPTVVNFFFAQRLVRSHCPRLGSSAAFKALMPRLAIALTVCMIAALVASLISSFYTHSACTASALRKLQQAGLAWFVFATLLPALLALATSILPCSTLPVPLGSGTTRAQAVLLATSSVLQAAGAAFRLAAACLPPAPRDAAVPWYFACAAFYVATFVPDIATLALYALFRADRRFYVPGGAGAPWIDAAQLVLVDGRCVVVPHGWSADGREAVEVEIEVKPQVLSVDLKTGQYLLQELGGYGRTSL